MIVECYDKKGAEVYEMIVKQILQEVQIYRSIKDVRVFVDPREPVFIIVIEVEKAASPVVLEDFAEYKYDKKENKVLIRIRDETYLPELLKKLWTIEEREKIQQPDRFEIVIENPTVKLEGLVVHDPSETLKRKVYDAIFRIIPEGFRVINDSSEGDIIAMTCSDDVIKNEWTLKCEKMIKEVKNGKV